MRIAALATVAALATACSAAPAPSASTAPAAPPVATSPTTPSIDERAIVRDELDRTLAEWSAEGALAILIEADTGRVVVAEGRAPGADAPELVEKPLVTGSTLKPLTVAAALEAGTVTPDTPIDCAARRYPEGYLHDSRSNGVLPVREALAVSSNVGASRILDSLGLARLQASFAKFHVFDPPGSIPTLPDEKGLRAGAFAGGEVAATSPLRLAAAYTVFYNDGVYHAPTLAEPAAPAERVLRPDTAATMKDLLAFIVESPIGTGGPAQVAGHKVAGKTGTAELSGGGYYASFVGAVTDVARPRVLLVGVLKPKDEGNGKTVAAPLFSRIATRLLGEPPP